MATSAQNSPSDSDKLPKIGGEGAATHASSAGDAMTDSGSRKSTSQTSTTLVVQPGHRIRDYELLELLGQGGMGSVWKAKHTRLKKFVAVKLLPQEKTSDEAAVARFNREMEAVGALRHPHIIEAHDAGEEAGTHYLVMEFVEGIELAALSKKIGPLPITDACELMRQTALGLQHAFEHGLVHRDIKPSNLLLAHDGQLKILDLGLALLLGDQPAEELTSTGQVMGTLDYIAPEQLADTHSVDIRADLYSLGCTLFRLLTTEPPFAGPSLNTAAKKMFAHSFTPAPKLLDRRPDVPAELSALVARLLEKKPDARFATPREVATALAPFCVGHNLPALLASSSAPSSASDPFASTVIPESKMAVPGRPAVPNEDKSAEGGQPTGGHPTDAREPLAPQPRRRPLVIVGAILAIVLLCVFLPPFLKRDASLTDDRKMAAPGRPAVPNNAANTKSTTSAKNSEDKTAEGGHPTSDATDERADWPEWAKELREPPPLEEWLKGRKVLTVQQDGSAMFQTIQAALDKVQPGEVIRVLDKGPYRERLIVTGRSGDYGLVSDVNTVVELNQWELETTQKTGWLGHSISGTRDLRIFGFTFVCTPPMEDKLLDPAPIPLPFFLRDMSGFCLENCVVLAPQRIDDPQSNIMTKSYARISGSQSLCVRHCVFGSGFRIIPFSTTPYTAIVAHNFFAGQQGDDLQVGIGLEKVSHEARIEQNIFHSVVAKHSIHFTPNQDTASDDRCLLTRNTIHLNSPGGMTLIAVSGNLGRDVTIRENLFSPSTRGFCFGAGAIPFVAKAREEWLVRNNWGGQRDPGIEWIPLTDPSHTGELPYLSLDAEHPNFLRLDPAKLDLAPATSPTSRSRNREISDERGTDVERSEISRFRRRDGTLIPGALPPGPPPPEGDWFTRLQSRLKEAQVASRAQYK